MAKTYRKKPVTVQAIRWTGLNTEEVRGFCGDKARIEISDAAWRVQKGAAVAEVYIDTLEGSMRANHGDYIIRGVNGEFYPCKPDIFQKTYEETENKTQEE